MYKQYTKAYIYIIQLSINNIYTMYKQYNKAYIHMYILCTLSLESGVREVAPFSGERALLREEYLHSSAG